MNNISNNLYCFAVRPDLYVDREKIRRTKGVNAKQLIKIKKLLRVGKFRVNKLNKYGYYPLYVAVSNNRVDIVKRLLEHGTQEINNRNIDGLTSLHLAAARNFVDIVEVLLNYGANANVKDINGFTPMHWVIIKDNIEVAKVLMKYDNVEAKLTKNNTIIYLTNTLGSDNLTWIPHIKWFRIFGR
jgi:ankyrin repeat protein